jgi:hypothetical protein
MARTQISGIQVLDGSINRQDLNTTVAGQSVITKVLAGTGMVLTSTGVDSGTGDVTVGLVTGAQTIFIQDAAPPDVGKYLWIQTNYNGVSGATTIWIGLN